MTDAVSSEKRSLEQTVYEDHVKRMKLRPPKKNNVKKEKVALQSVVHSAKRECSGCKAKFDANEKELMQLEQSERPFTLSTFALISQLKATLSLGLPTVEDDEHGNGDCICTGCGAVRDRSAALGSDFSDFGRSYPSSKAHTRKNYIRERMRQYCMDEPPIPDVDLEKLRVAYNGGYGSLDPSLGVLEYDPIVNKDTVREIIIAAGLAPKKYTEKWLNIRKFLGAQPPSPKPDQALVQFVLDRFDTVIKVWETQAERLCIPGHKRKSLFSYNYIIRMLFLQHSVEAYKEHYKWFLIVGETKKSEIERLWAAICMAAEWPPYFPVHHPDGNITRATMKLAFPRSQ
jgi:hypothetical protein